MLSCRCGEGGGRGSGTVPHVNDLCAEEGGGEQGGFAGNVKGRGMGEGSPHPDWRPRARLAVEYPKGYKALGGEFEEPLEESHIIATAEHNRGGPYGISIELMAENVRLRFWKDNV